MIDRFKHSCSELFAIASMYITVIIILLVMYMVIFLCATASAQNVKRQGNTFIEQKDTTKTQIKGKVYETDYVFIDKDGKTYPICLSSNGNAFIMKISKSSGRKYRKYLPEVTKQLQNRRK